MEKKELTKGIDNCYLQHMLDITSDYSDFFSKFSDLVDAFKGASRVSIGKEEAKNLESNVLGWVKRVTREEDYGFIENTINSFKKLGEYDKEIRKEQKGKSYSTRKDAIDDYLKLLIKKEGAESFVKRAEYIAEMIGILQGFCNPTTVGGRVKLKIGRAAAKGFTELKKEGAGESVDYLIKTIQDNNAQIDSLKKDLVRKEVEYVKKLNYNGGK